MVFELFFLVAKIGCQFAPALSSVPVENALESEPLMPTKMPGNPALIFRAGNIL